jgi:galactoside O-acetyltransferase
MNPKEFTNVQGGVVTLKKFVQIGAGTIIMPSVTIYRGAAIGAMSFVKRDVTGWTIHAGNPLRYIKQREQGMLNFLECTQY